jgi:hypothetical protein
MSHPNYPAGMTQGEHDRTFADAANQFPNTESCFLCGREMQQDDDTRRWFLADDVAALGMNYMLGYHDALDVFETESGWCCGQQCWNDRVALNEYESIPDLPSTPCQRCAYVRGAHGMISTACPDGNGLFQEPAMDESIPARPVLMLVKGGRA